MAVSVVSVFLCPLRSVARFPLHSLGAWAESVELHPKTGKKHAWKADRMCRAQGQAGTHLLQLQLLGDCKQYSCTTEASGVQVSDFQSPALSGTKDLNLQLSGTRRQLIHSTIKSQTHSRADLHSTVYLNNDANGQDRAIVISRLGFGRFCHVFNFTSENTLCSRQESCVIYKNAR